MNPAPPLQIPFDAARFQSLLRAAFLPDARAGEAFAVWNAQINWEAHLNGEEYRLLPQLYRNLTAQGVEHILLGKFKGIARKAWYNNNLFFHRLVPTLRALTTGTRLTVLFGGAMALRYDNEYVLNFGGDFGIGVRAAQAERAFLSLKRSGWIPSPAISERALASYLEARFFHEFYNPAGDRLLLQWQLLPHCPAIDSESAFWDDAAEVELEGTPLMALAPTAQLLLSLLYGSTPRGSPHPRRMSETLLLLGTVGASIDWDKLLALARQQRVIRAVRQTVAAAQPFSPHIPAELTARLDGLPVNPSEESEAALWHAATRRERAQKLWRIAARRSCEPGATRRALTFPAFLQHWWGLESVFELAPRALAAARGTSHPTVL